MVRSNMKNSMTNRLTSMTMVKTCSFELFYQVGLSDFGNFGTMKLDPPLAIRGLVQIAADQERQGEGDSIMTGTGDPDDSIFDWDEAVEVRHMTVALLLFSSACLVFAYTYPSLQLAYATYIKLHAPAYTPVLTKPKPTSAKY